MISRMLLNYGENHRIWPFADTRNRAIYASVARVRPSAKPVCKLFRSGDYGESWTELADFHSMNKRNTTTGQPFVSTDSSIFVPVWNAGFYTHGVLGLAIYRSDDKGVSWIKMYEDLHDTYGKHFFESPEGDLYLGVGQGGGGTDGKVSPRPGKSRLLLSRDTGQNWEEILSVNYPTALYSGVALDNETVLVAAREKKSLFLSPDGGKTWKETHLGHKTRSVSYVKELSKIVVSSDSALFISDDVVKWSRFDIPVKGLMLRYPTWHEGRLYMSGVAWRSYIVSTDLNTWALNHDVTRETSSNLGARMTMLDDNIFIGDEANGTLIRVELPFESNIPINLIQLLKGNLSCLGYMAKHVIRRII